MPGPLTDGLPWLVVGLFVTGAVTERFDRALARYLLSSARVAFAMFWAFLTPHFALEMHSIVEGTGSLLAVPASLSVAYLVYAGRDELVVLSRAVAVMGVIYLPFAAIHPVAVFALGVFGIGPVAAELEQIAGTICYPVLVGAEGALVLGTVGFVLGAGVRRIHSRIVERDIRR